MTGKTHVTVGCLTMGCIAVHHMEGFEINHVTIMPMVALITTAVGSYLPDIDLPQSHLGKKYSMISKHLKHRGLTHYWYFIPLLLFTLMMGFTLVPSTVVFGVNIALLLIFAGGCAGIAIPAFKHGNVDLYDALHCALMVGAISAVLTDLRDTTVICSLLFGLFFGWMMHIFADLFNKPGVQIFPGVKVHLASVKTKSIMEKGIFTRNWQEPLWLLCYSAVILCITFRESILQAVRSVFI